MVLLLTSCATVNLVETNPVGKVYEGEIQLGKKSIPLPDGKWIVIANGKKNDFFRIYLLKEHENKLFSYITIDVDTPTKLDAEYGYVASKYLKRENVHHVVVNKNKPREAQDGWLINHLIVHFDPKKKYPILQKAADYIRSHGYIISHDMIQIYHRFTGKYVKRKYLVVSYHYNTEAEGFSPSAKRDWALSDWHILRINKDPKKVAYIEKLKKEHTIMHDKIREGFEK